MKMDATCPTLDPHKGGNAILARVNGIFHAFRKEMI